MGYKKIPEWKAAFGQTGAAQKHLANQKVQVGDIFLFYGWFRETQYIDGRLRYTKESLDKHIIYGYMQIGEIITGEKIKDYTWHPHAWGERGPNNTLYIATEQLMIEDTPTNIPGWGNFMFSEELVLTKPNCNRRMWKLQSWMKDAEITYHKKAKHHEEDYFLNVCRGQEFVISENKSVTEWALKLINNQYT